MSDGIKNNIGPFMYADGALRRRTAEGVDYIVGIAGAYNAMGLIGSEYNGIFVLDETNKNVLTDQEHPESSGYHGPSKAQWDALSRIMILSDAEFVHWIMSRPRYRGTGAWEQ